MRAVPPSMFRTSPPTPSCTPHGRAAEEHRGAASGRSRPGAKLRHVGPRRREAPLAAREAAGRDARGEPEVGAEAEVRRAPEDAADDEALAGSYRRRWRSSRAARGRRRRALAVLDAVAASDGEPRADVGVRVACRCRTHAAAKGARREHSRRGDRAEVAACGSRRASGRKPRSCRPRGVPHFPITSAYRVRRPGGCRKCYPRRDARDGGPAMATAGGVRRRAGPRLAPARRRPRRWPRVVPPRQRAPRPPRIGPRRCRRRLGSVLAPSTSGTATRTRAARCASTTTTACSIAACALRSCASRAAQAGPTTRSDVDERLDLRLVQLAFRAAYHFGGAPIVIVSATRKGTHGKHGTGDALDFALEGVKARVLAAYLRGTPRAGVGIYTHPKTQYVHLDVRDTASTGSTHRRPASPGASSSCRSEASRARRLLVAAMDLPEPASSSLQPRAARYALATGDASFRRFCALGRDRRRARSTRGGRAASCDRDGGGRDVAAREDGALRGMTIVSPSATSDVCGTSCSWARARRRASTGLERRSSAPTRKRKGCARSVPPKGCRARSSGRRARGRRAPARTSARRDRRGCGRRGGRGSPPGFARRSLRGSARCARCPRRARA